MLPSFIHNSKFKILPRSGFTLIELLVSVTVTALLSSFVIVYTTNGRAQTALYVEQSKIIQVIVRAKSLAISTYDAPDPLCGYGVHFDQSAGAYDLFSYRDSACNLISFIDPTDSAHYVSLHRYVLPKNLMLRDGENAISDILFIPPDPKTLLWSEGVILTTGTGNVYLAAKDGPWNTNLHVSVAGQISF